jgi:hypothetical protein
MAHLGMIYIVSLGNVLVSSTINDQKVIYPCPFAFNFLGSMLVFSLMCLTYTIEKKIVLMKDDCFRPPITIKSHNLHEGNIRRVVGEITSYHKRD